MKSVLYLVGAAALSGCVAVGGAVTPFGGGVVVGTSPSVNAPQPQTAPATLAIQTGPPGRYDPGGVCNPLSIAGAPEPIIPADC